MPSFSGSDIFLFIVGFFLPPLAGNYKLPYCLMKLIGYCPLGLKRGCGADFLISIALTLLGHIPGIGYSWYIIYKYRDDPNSDHRHRHGQVYVPVPNQENHQNYQATPPVQHPVN